MSKLLNTYLVNLHF